MEERAPEREGTGCSDRGRCVFGEAQHCIELTERDGGEGKRAEERGEERSVHVCAKVLKDRDEDMEPRERHRSLRS